MTKTETNSEAETTGPGAVGIDTDFLTVLETEAGAAKMTIARKHVSVRFLSQRMYCLLTSTDRNRVRYVTVSDCVPETITIGVKDSLTPEAVEVQ